MEKIFHANGNQKKAGVAIIIPDKINFKPKMVIRDKEDHYIMIKRSIHQEDMTIVSICTPNSRAAKYIKQILRDLKGEIDNSTRIIGDINTNFQQ